MPSLRPNTRRTRDDGFALIELLVVILVIGVLAGIGLPLLFAQQRKAMDASAKSDVRNAVTQVESCLADATPGGSAASCATPANDGLAKLHRIDFPNTSAALSASGEPVFRLTAMSESGVIYVIDRAANGATTYETTGSDARWWSSSSG
jgi:type IV pilus assembly protein PilA